MFLSREITQSSLETIGLHFGRRDHSTVIHACKTIGDKIKSDLIQSLSVCVGHSGLDPEYRGGIVAERFFSESNQRHMYARWQEFMNAKSWADIHIDPITAKFEGTATMKG